MILPVNALDAFPTHIIMMTVGPSHFFAWMHAFPTYIRCIGYIMRCFCCWRKIWTHPKPSNSQKIYVGTLAVGNIGPPLYTVCMYVCMVITYRRVWINRVRLPILLVVSWTGKMNIPLSPCVPENLVSRDGFRRPVPRQAAHLHTQAESGAYLWDYSRVSRRRPFMKTPYAIGLVPSLSGHHAIAYRWRSLPRVHRHRASKPQGSSERVLPSWQVTMDQLICASLSHTH